MIMIFLEQPQLKGLVSPLIQAEGVLVFTGKCEFSLVGAPGVTPISLVVTGWCLALERGRRGRERVEGEQERANEKRREGGKEGEGEQTNKNKRRNKGNRTRKKKEGEKAEIQGMGRIRFRDIQ